jgi:hypothetical protein
MNAITERPPGSTRWQTDTNFVVNCSDVGQSWQDGKI